MTNVVVTNFRKLVTNLATVVTNFLKIVTTCFERKWLHEIWTTIRFADHPARKFGKISIGNIKRATTTTSAFISGSSRCHN